MIYVQRDAIDSRKKTNHQRHEKKRNRNSQRKKNNLTQCLYQIREVDYCIIEPVTMKKIREKKNNHRVVSTQLNEKFG